MQDVLNVGEKNQGELSYMFTNWEHMTLKDGLEMNKDYYLLSMANWMKLNAAFGGCPEIPIFDYHIKNTIMKEDGEEVVEKITHHDFNPIKVKLT